MRAHITSALCLAFAAACFCDAAAAQRRRAAPEARAPVAAPARPAARTAWIISEQPYDEDGQSTTLVSLQPMPLGAATAMPGAVSSPPAAKPAFSFGVNFSYEGKSAANFKNVSLNIFSRAGKCHLAEKPSLTLTLDGQPLVLEYQPQAKGADGVWSVSSDTESGPCDETLIAYISPATLARLAAAKSVSGQVGAEAFRLTEANLGALRDLVARVGTPRPKR